MLQFCRSAVWHGSLKSMCHQGCAPPWHAGEEFTSSPFLVPRGLPYSLAGGLFIFKDGHSGPWLGVALSLLPLSFLFLWPSVTSWVASDSCSREGSERCLLVLLWCIRFQPHHYLGGKGGLGWHSMPGTMPGIAVSGGHSRTGVGPPHYFTFFVCCTVDIPPGFSWSPWRHPAPREPV